MVYQSRLSGKGQVTIPVEIREKLALEPGDVIVYEVEGDRAFLRRGEPLDVAFHAALSHSLDEWASAEDEDAFRCYRQPLGSGRVCIQLLQIRRGAAVNLLRRGRHSQLWRHGEDHDCHDERDAADGMEWTMLHGCSPFIM